MAVRRPRRAAPHRRQRRPRRRLDPPGEVQAARRPGRRQRRRGGDVVLVVDPNVHTLLDFHHHPHQKAGNGEQGAGSHRNGADGADLELRVPDGTVVLDADGEVLADLTGAGARFVAAQGGRGGLGNAALASPRRKAPGIRAARRAGRDPRRRARAQERRRRRPGRLPERRQVVADRGDVRRPAQDRRLPVHHPRAEPRRRQRRRHHVHRRRRARPDPRRGGRARASAWTSCATSSGARCCCTCSTAPRSSPAAIRSATWTRSRPSWASTQGTFGELLAKPRLVALNKVDVPEARDLAELVRPDLEARGLRVFEISARLARGPARADLRPGRGRSRPTGRAARPPEPHAHRAAAQGGRRRRVHRRAPTRRSRAASSSAATSRSAGCARPTSTTTRRSATWPTGWPGSASRRSWPGSAPSAARP